MEILPRALRLLGVAEPDIDDVLQEVLLAAYESLDRFDPAWSPPEREAGAAGDPLRREGRRQHGSPEARWVFGIAWRKVSHHLDRAYRRREVPDGLRPASRYQAIDPAPLSEERIAEQERLEVAREVLLTIAPERRVLLVLHEAYEVPLVDIARELGLNYNTASNRLRLAREDYRAAVKRLRPERRQALRACWLVFPLASDFLVRDGGASAAAPPAGVPGAPAGSSQRARLARLGRAVGSAAAGGAATAAVLLALAPSRPAWARRFEAALVYELPAASAGRAAPPSPPSQQTPESRPVAAAVDAPARPCPAAPRAAPPAGAREDAFAEERRLLAAAQERLSTGDPAGALRQLAAHEARFPAGRLKSVREQLRTAARARLAHPAPGASAHPAPGASAHPAPGASAHPAPGASAREPAR
ncbi:sigma-70 family RNA polymerase sigma factor [Sorangium sp. So ce281]|uniref:RNA polymerase sigma factor n=1 Tax=unclassified Sorangium TaxID=2621164 RepID=UPI003F5DC96D